MSALCSSYQNDFLGVATCNLGVSRVYLQNGQRKFVSEIVETTREGESAAGEPH
jgi:hypothetical protein